MTAALLSPLPAARAQEQLPWGSSERPRVVQPGAAPYDGDRPYRAGAAGQRDEPDAGPYGGPPDRGPADRRDDSPQEPGYRPATPVYPPAERAPDRYGDRPTGGDRPFIAERPYDPNRYGDQGPGRAYEPPPYEPDRERRVPYARGDQSESRTYSSSEINSAGHRFFGRITEGLANVIEYSFQRGGRPNGYILGEEGGAAFVAGLRYGEGTLHLKDGTRQKVYWQGPSIGYDFGAEGSKTMILVYDLEHPSGIYQTFGGVSGSAYLVGGVGITFMKSDDVVLAPIRSGLGLRIGANVGYLKYTRAPTWNPF